MSVGCCPDMFVWHQENKNTSRKSHRDVSLLKKNLASRNELREIENIGARDLLQVREFLVLICVKKTDYFDENSLLTCNEQLTS